MSKTEPGHLTFNNLSNNIYIDMYLYKNYCILFCMYTFRDYECTSNTFDFKHPFYSLPLKYYSKYTFSF